MIHKVRFGNIFREPFEDIWNKEDYVAFRDRFVQRKDMMEDAYQAFLNHRKHERGIPLEPPEPCRTCHKMLGV
jgi:hypothetical protein